MLFKWCKSSHCGASFVPLRVNQPDWVNNELKYECKCFVNADLLFADVQNIVQQTKNLNQVWSLLFPKDNFLQLSASRHMAYGRSRPVGCHSCQLRKHNSFGGLMVWAFFCRGIRWASYCQLSWPCLCLYDDSGSMAGPSRLIQDVLQSSNHLSHFLNTTVSSLWPPQSPDLHSVRM